ncbi:MAG: c-type cytochrome [Candidatus Eremiobacteraeota bacterium]|nr:c-type cytochrome [Candidatus Eremiobacteraeota bacterium]
MATKSAVISLALLSTGSLWWMTYAPERRGLTHHQQHHGARELVSPLETPEPEDPAEVQLGRRLFAEKRLSGGQTVSCQSCHDLQAGGVDHLVRSVGDHGALGNINAPTVYNAYLNSSLFWDGRAETLEEQAGAPITNPKEMNAGWSMVLARLNADASYHSAFQKVYGTPPSREGVVAALAAYERTLITLDSPFDRYLRGHRQAISAEALRGYEKFRSYGCISCHQGANVGGNMYQKFGVMGDYFQDRGHVTSVDWGRFNVTHKEEDRYVFRVPSLRNVARTAPYFHDGSATNLPTAIRVMAHYQLGRHLSQVEVNELAAFLNSLTGVARP